MTIYFIPGLGADHRLFKEISIPGHRLEYIKLPVPTANQSMDAYAREISKQIDTTEKFILIGVSLGGMISCELASILNPHKVILISSAQCNHEIPKLYKFQGRTGINRLIPGWIIKYSAVLLQGIFENDSWKDRKFFRKMILAKPAVYYKRTVNMIVNWNRTESNPAIVHIHGSGDRTLPYHLVKPKYTVKNGSHMMVYTRAREVNKILEEVLAQN